MENKIKEALKIIFDFNYDGLLNEYLNTNLLATEIDFIDYIATNQNSHLEKLSPQIDFFFNEKINSDTEYENFIMRDEYWFYREYQNYLIEKRTKLVKALPPQPIKTKADILKEQLSQYGFFELEKVKTLSEQSKVSIIEKIAESGLPYAIAMFDYLQFIPYLEKKHFDSKYKLNREVSKWFDSDKEGRAVKGNISSLLKNTTENKDRYTAYKHKENVIKDYELLK
jgi:hypothetical protein